MAKKLIIGNWKMNGDVVSNAALVSSLNFALLRLSNVQIAICPPFPYLAQVASLARASHIELGAQNVSHRSKGALTGEVSGSMLTDIGCRYVLVGHSERRELFGEDDTVVALKFQEALECGLIPVLCVGETLTQRMEAKTVTIVVEQIRKVIDQVGISQIGRGIIAYEPVWAIGTGETATPEHVQSVHQSIREFISNIDSSVARQLKILYGGSVNATNASALFSQPDIDGGLIGGASLDASAFHRICEKAGLAALPTGTFSDYPPQ